MKNEHHWWQVLFTSGSYCKKSKRELKFIRERDRKSHYLPEGNHWRSVFLLRDRHWGVTCELFWGKSKFTGHLCYLRYFCSCAHYNDVYSLMKFSIKMHTVSLRSWWRGGGGGCRIVLYRLWGFSRLVSYSGI